MKIDGIAIDIADGRNVSLRVESGDEAELEKFKTSLRNAESRISCNLYPFPTARGGALTVDIPNIADSGNTSAVISILEQTTLTIKRQ